MHQITKYVIFVLFLVIRVTQATYIDEQQLKAGFMVTIRSKYNRHRCGGALISSRSVVTSADCVVNESLSDLLVIIGTNTLNQGVQFMPDVYQVEKETDHVKQRRHIKDFHHSNEIENNEIGDGLSGKGRYLSDQKDNFPLTKKFEPVSTKINPSQIFSVKRKYIHIDYDGKFLNNIAVLELDREIDALQGVKAIKINDDPTKIQVGDQLSAYGWDNQLLKKSHSNEISKVTFILMHPNKCSQIFGESFKKDAELCLKSVLHVPGPGFGGSPILKDNVLIGIISYGATYNNVTFTPTVALNLTNYLTFIEEVDDDIEFKSMTIVERFVVVVKQIWVGFYQSFTTIFHWF